MGILKTTKSEKPTASTAKRRSAQIDFASLKPLKPGGVTGFSQFRDGSGSLDKYYSKGSLDEMESDDEEIIKDEEESKVPDGDVDDFRNHMLSPEDAKKQVELAEGVKKIKVWMSSIALWIQQNRLLSRYSQPCTNHYFS